MLERLMRGLPADIPETTASEAARTRDEESAIFLDVREPSEWDEGHIPGAVHIPLGSLAERLGELDPDTPVIAVCHVGQRSLYATAMLLDAGFANAHNLAGGMVAWEAAGEPIER